MLDKIVKTLESYKPKVNIYVHDLNNADIIAVKYALRKYLGVNWDYIESNNAKWYTKKYGDLRVTCFLKEE